MYQLQFPSDREKTIIIEEYDSLAALLAACEMVAEEPAELYKDHKRVCTISRGAIENWRPGWMTTAQAAAASADASML
jgi:hypothetical protein